MFVTISVSAPEFSVFAPGSWNDQIGNEVPFTLRETEEGPVIGVLGKAVIIAAEITENGREVILTLDIRENAEYVSRPETSGMSVKNQGEEGK